MTSRELYRWSDSDTRILNQLTRDRRDILDALGEQSLPITEYQLAATLTARKSPDRSTMKTRTKLRHVDLPKLADAGQIEWDDSEGVVTAIDLSTGDRSAQAAGGDALEGELRVVLNLIETLRGPQHERDIAYGVAAITGSSDPDSEAVEEATINARHRYLPKLDQAGLVEYDSEAGTVAAAGSPE